MYQYLLGKVSTFNNPDELAVEQKYQYLLGKVSTHKDGAIHFHALFGACINIY